MSDKLPSVSPAAVQVAARRERRRAAAGHGQSASRIRNGGQGFCDGDVVGIGIERRAAVADIECQVVMRWNEIGMIIPRLDSTVVDCYRAYPRSAVIPERNVSNGKQAAVRDIQSGTRRAAIIVYGKIAFDRHIAAFDIERPGRAAALSERHVPAIAGCFAVVEDRAGLYRQCPRAAATTDTHIIVQDLQRSAVHRKDACFAAAVGEKDIAKTVRA